MPLTALTRLAGTVYLMVCAGLLVLFLYALLRGRAEGVGILESLALIFGWPLVILNARLRLRLWSLVRPG